MKRLSWQPGSMPSIVHSPKSYDANVLMKNVGFTTGRRLRAAGVSNETRKDILGHESGDMTTHYSVDEIKELINGVELIAQESTCSTPTLIFLMKCKLRDSCKGN